MLKITKKIAAEKAFEQDKIWLKCKLKNEKYIIGEEDEALISSHFHVHVLVKGDSCSVISSASGKENWP